MSGPDLVSASYPTTYPGRKLLALTSNVATPNVSPRSNLEWFGPNMLTDTAAALVSGKITIAAIPVEVGDVISKVTVLAGATAESGGSHAWAAIYSGAATPTLVGAQSTDVTGATAIAASAAYSFTLATAATVTAANAPFGYVIAAVSVTGTVPSLVTVGGTVAAAGQYAWFTGGPAVFAGTGGSALGATAPTTYPSITAATAIPVVILT